MVIEPTPAPVPEPTVLIPDPAFKAAKAVQGVVLRDQTPAAKSWSSLDEYVGKEMSGNVVGTAKDLKSGWVFLLARRTRVEILSVREAHPFGDPKAASDFEDKHPAGALVEVNILEGPQARSTLFISRSDVGQLIEVPAISVRSSDPEADTVRPIRRKVVKSVQDAKAAAAFDLARAIERAGRVDEAIRAYRVIIRDYPVSPSAAKAQNELDSLTGKPRH